MTNQTPPTSPVDYPSTYRSDQPIVELKHVQRRFIKEGKVIPVIQDVDLSIYPNEILCIVGESGCGTGGKARDRAGPSRAIHKFQAASGRFGGNIFRVHRDRAQRILIQPLKHGAGGCG